MVLETSKVSLIILELNVLYDISVCNVNWMNFSYVVNPF